MRGLCQSALITNRYLYSSLKQGRFLSNVISVNDPSFTKLTQAPGKKVFYFTAKWCPPCRKIAPIYDKISQEFPDIVFAKIDVDESPNAAALNAINSIPTFQFKSGETTVEQFSGADESLLRSHIKNLESAS
mmetsp:Transcript_5684/g.5880  ORF Transcript_5684/g.5880 Transcript_5684/m.5880 type:complete len:132 (-) Transcript_5684:93-488(-)